MEKEIKLKSVYLETSIFRYLTARPSRDLQASAWQQATLHGVDFFLTWNCRHINNAETKPIIRAICLKAGYQCPEICAPQELLPEENSDV